MGRFSILEPGYQGGCDDKIRATVAETQKGHQQKCLISANAGFFNMTSATVFNYFQFFVRNFVDFSIIMTNLQN